MRAAIPWATSIVTLLGMWLVGSGSWRGWVVGLGNQALWIAFAVTFEAWGLLPLSAALIFVYTRNLIRWRRNEAHIALVIAGTIDTDPDR